MNICIDKEDLTQTKYETIENFLFFRNTITKQTE